jgi:hypothetical protein
VMLRQISRDKKPDQNKTRIFASLKKQPNKTHQTGIVIRNVQRRNLLCCLILKIAWSSGLSPLMPINVNLMVKFLKILPKISISSKWIPVDESSDKSLQSRSPVSLFGITSCKITCQNIPYAHHNFGNASRLLTLSLAAHAG